MISLRETKAPFTLVRLHLNCITCATDMLVYTTTAFLRLKTETFENSPDPVLENGHVTCVLGCVV